MNQYVKTKEACKILGVIPETVRRWADAGQIKTIRTPAGQR